ncbi:putative F420-0 ABC transporter permease subunit [Crystallibacter degradans]|uniref:putative F420-0 ABC transporter permease subunit n=1 Tax=Crystallibacter degradans TaxID=2726743 RepID=UPI001475C866|nr:putative F420-0 ABC transporter permease subunit [Arthrobacter sp. SF27]NMR28570.1 iron chelate uptake ABC transporter family permease subunit [Arthrobacter sp. SF27]
MSLREHSGHKLTTTAPATVARSRSGRQPISGVLWGAVLLAALVASVLVAVSIGPANLSPLQVLGSVLRHLGLRPEHFGVAVELTAIQDGIVWELRLPRLLTAGLVGAGLAVSGAVMQALTRNPLADPYLLGLSSGASLGAVAVLLLGAAVLLPVAAFAGAMAAMALTLGLASALGVITPTRTVLAGLAVSALASALASFIIFFSAQGDSYREVLSWMMGSLSAATWGSVAITGVAFAVAGTPVLLSGRILDGFAFGDTAAAALGLNVTAIRWLLLGGTAVLTGAMVSVSGSIGFVGLILPHAVRLLTGARHRALLPLSALAGALFMVWADTLARTIFDPREIPVGIITALLGAPVFIIMLWRWRNAS